MADKTPAGRLPPPDEAAVAGRREHRVRVALRWRDIDTLGHLNQSVYHELLEEGRVAIMGELLGWPEGDVDRYPFVLAHVELDYRHEVRHADGELEIVSTLAHVGRSSLRLEHELRLPDGTLAASGHTVMVAWDPQRRDKRTLSDAERAALGVLA
jgi:acyl-CoA thioester hydrolase